MSLLLSRQPDVQPSKEGGYSLIEVMVVMVIMALMIGFVTTSFSNSQLAAAKATTRLSEGDQARSALEEISKTLRASVRYSTIVPAFLPSTATVGGKAVVQNGKEMWFYTNINTAATTACGPRVAHYYLDSSNTLWEDVTPPDTSSVSGAWTYTGSPQVHRALAQKVVPPGGAQPYLFTFLANIGGTTLNDASTSSGTVSDANGAQVGDVQVQLTVNNGGRLGAPSSLRDTIRLVNADAPAGSGAGC